MSHAVDIQRITASVFKYLSDDFSGTIHFPGAEESGSDTSWIEPWVSVTMAPARGRDWLYHVALTINIFQKRTEDTYLISALASELVDMFKANRLAVMSHDLVLPLRVGTISFDEPEVLDLGETRSSAKARIGLRQFTLRCEGRIYPMAA